MQKILVIQQKMIGDVLVSTILCETLAKCFPNAQIDYLIHEGTYDVVKGNHPNYNVLLFTDKERKSNIALWKFAQKIKQNKYDIVIDAYSKLESWILVALSGAQKRISFRKKYSNFLYTHLVERHQQPHSNLGLVIEHRLKLLEPLGIKLEDCVTVPSIKLSNEEIKTTKTTLSKYHISKPLIMINIIGSSVDKTYPASYMTTIIEAVAKHPVEILFNYTPNQQQEAQNIYNQCTKETQNKIHFDILGNNLRSFMGLVNECICIIGNDGGAMNMGKALKKPSFIIFSPWIEKKAWATFEDGDRHLSVHLDEYEPEWTLGKTQKEIKAINESLYQKFVPSYFLDKIDSFIERRLQELS